MVQESRNFWYFPKVSIFSKLNKPVTFLFTSILALIWNKRIVINYGMRVASIGGRGLMVKKLTFIGRSIVCEWT